LQTLIQEITGHIDAYVNERIEDFIVFSKDLTLQEFVLQSNAEFEKLSDIQGYIGQKDREWVSAQKNEITPFMQQLINNKLGDEMRENIKFYGENYGYRLYGEVFATNKHGANAAQTGKTSDYRQDDEEWWQKAKSDGVYVEELKYDQSADVYSTSIGVRIDDNNGEFIGVMKAVLNLEEIISVIRETEAQKKFSSAEYTLVDEKGRILFSTRNYEIFQPFSLFSAIKDKEGALTAKDPQTGADKLIIHAHSHGYKDYKGLGGILAVDVDMGEISKPIHDLILTILIFAIVLIVLAGIIGFYIYSTISASLGKFEKAVDEIMHGNMETRVEIAAKDEFRTLAGAFNSMVQELKDLKRIGMVKKAEKELEAVEASHKLGFMSEESYQKSKKRLTEILEKPKNIDARLLQEKGFIKTD